MPGPAPTPTETLKARGSWRAKAREGEPVSDGEKPDRPENVTGEAAAEWDRLIVRLETMRLLDSADRGLLAAYCWAWARLDYAEARTADLLTEAQEQRRKKSSGARTRALERIDKAVWKTEVSWGRALDRFIKAADRLGVGAAARARVKVEAGQPAPGRSQGKSRFFKTVG